MKVWVVLQSGGSDWFGAEVYDNQSEAKKAAKAWKKQNGYDYVVEAYEIRKSFESV